GKRQWAGQRQLGSPRGTAAPGGCRVGPVAVDGNGDGGRGLGRVVRLGVVGAAVPGPAVRLRRDLRQQRDAPTGPADRGRAGDVDTSCRRYLKGVSSQGGSPSFSVLAFDKLRSHESDPG